MEVPTPPLTKSGNPLTLTLSRTLTLTPTLTPNPNPNPNPYLEEESWKESSEDDEVVTVVASRPP